MTKTNEFIIWQYEVPVVCMNTDTEFDVWLYETPVEDFDESFTPTTITVRRRVAIF
jgi:hypothetical protein